MEALKVIPQVFFDLIARVVPGSVGIIAYLVLSGKTWEATIAYLFGQSFAQESTTLSFLIFLGGGYIIGELISPAAKKVQRIGEKKIPRSWEEYKEMRKKHKENKQWEKAKEQSKKEEKQKKWQEVQENRQQMQKKWEAKRAVNESKEEEKVLVVEEEGEKETTFKEKKLKYDRLRLEHPEVGALCAKIRAEFTMHNSLAVVFAITALFYPCSVLPFHWYILGLLLLLVFTTAHRGRTTNSTFNETVAKFNQVLNDKKSGPESSL